LVISGSAHEWENQLEELPIKRRRIEDGPVGVLSQPNLRILVRWAALAFLVLHGLLALLLPQKLEPLSTLCIVLAELAALIACLLTAQKTNPPARVLWRLMALSILLHSIAISADMITETLGIDGSNPAPVFQVLFSSLYGVPLLLAVSIPFDPRTGRSVKVVNACLALVTGGFFYVLIFSVLSIHGSGQPVDVVFIIAMFDALDFFLAVAATIRAFGADQPQERRFFYVAAIFLWVNTVFPAIHNRILIRHDYVVLDLLIAAPYLLLLVLISTDLPRAFQNPRRSRRLIRLVRSGSPIFLSLGLLLLGIAVSRTHFLIGTAGIVLAIVFYGALNMLTQSGRIEAEEALIAAKGALEKLVDIDSLTGIPNRRAFDRRIHIECRVACRNLQPVSVMMVDVDYFKQLNDTVGHMQGDICLVQIAHALLNALPRANDVVARFGGDEFAILLPSTGKSGALDVARRLHEVIADLKLDHPSVPTQTVTISIGISTSGNASAPSPTGLLRKADQSLYKAKELGRNRTEFLALDEESA
jgi:diguanylate cyclase (GGDEF)-like protein